MQPAPETERRRHQLVIRAVIGHFVDPSASVSKDFQLTILETTDGRTLTGFVVGESDNAISLQSFNEKIALPAAEIRLRQTSPVSMMPEGLLLTLQPDEIRDLIAYLSHSSQVPLPN